MKLPRFSELDKTWKLRLYVFLAGLVVGGFIGLVAAIVVIVLVFVVLFVLPQIFAMGKARADEEPEKPKDADKPKEGKS